MSAAELQRWWAYYQVEPWGELRGDLRMGILASAMVNLWLSKGQRTAPRDFMPDFWEAPAPRPSGAPRARQAPEQMLAVLLRGTQAAGGYIDPQIRSVLDVEAP